MNTEKRVLIYGYGNPGRRDDGMGIRITEMVEEWKQAHNLNRIDVDSNYQLNVEDAEKVSRYDLVIFVDASQETDLTNFRLTEIKPNNQKVEFTMHAVSPAYIIHLCEKLFDKKPQAKLLSIKGYRWEFQEGLSDSALLNMERAFIFLQCRLMNELDIKFSGIKCN
jgi:hydrogenase maturation protease